MSGILLRSRSTRWTVLGFFAFVGAICCAFAAKVIGHQGSASSDAVIDGVRQNLSASALRISEGVLGLCFAGMMASIVVLLVENVVFSISSRRNVTAPFAVGAYCAGGLLLIASVSSLVCFLALR